CVLTKNDAPLPSFSLSSLLSGMGHVAFGTPDANVHEQWWLEASAAFDSIDGLDKLGHWVAPGGVRGLAHRLSPPRHAPPVGQALSHRFRRLRRIEGFGIEAATDPFEQLFVLLVVGVLDCLHEVGVPPDAAAVLWRAGPLPLQAKGVLHLWVGLHDA